MEERSETAAQTTSASASASNSSRALQPSRLEETGDGAPPPEDALMSPAIDYLDQIQSITRGRTCKLMTEWRMQKQWGFGKET